MNIKAIFQRRKLWTIAVYKLKDESEIFELGEHRPFHFFGEKGLRRNAQYQATTADPFLFVHNDRLYLFYEIQTDFGIGEIWAQSMDTHGVWTNHGQVLKEDFHLSYPQVFFYDGQIWMIPEAASSGKVWLYTAEAFPYQWRKTRVLIDEPLVDSSLVIQQEGLFLLGTTRTNELKIYFSPNLSQEFVSTGWVITNDKSISRNAGRPLCIQDVLYRVAQNCQHDYGQNISLLQIDQLSFDKYSEHITTADLYKTKPKWMEAGYHHISTALFVNEHFVAVDGMRRDRYINTLLLIFFKLFNKSMA
jgi:hypothetical protein